MNNIIPNEEIETKIRQDLWDKLTTQQLNTQRLLLVNDIDRIYSMLAGYNNPTLINILENLNFGLQRIDYLLNKPR